ncbi:MAG TPA: hypothetical protein VLB44_01260, partial [Kofleriaceae bacterium]|nr:hypothetical protein [Kofleriaceae bacterium]
MVERLAVLCALAGCNQIFGLTETQLNDGGDTADALPPGCVASPRFELDYDSYLVDETPRGRTPHDALLVTADQPALLRFGVAPNAMRITAAVVHLSAVDAADECGGPCAPCPATTATRYQIYWGRHSWAEAYATATVRQFDTTNMVNQLWDAPYATGAGDRSALVADHALPAVSNTHALDLPITTTDITAVPAGSPWLHQSSDGSWSLSLQLRADGPLAIASDDRDNSSCADGLPSA